jgi:hypothetical protein
MQGKGTSTKRSTERAFGFLLCDITHEIESTFPAEQWVPSPIQCLDRAVDRGPGLIIVRFGQIPIRERETLVELTVVLKRNSHTRECPILALLHSKHRKLIEDLAQAKVDYIRYIEDIKLNSIQMRKIIDELRPDDRIERHLAMLCPFLHYKNIDSHHEVRVCGAYLDLLVLGGHRLHELCETESHLHCEYYLNPRRKS